MNTARILKKLMISSVLLGMSGFALAADGGVSVSIGQPLAFMEGLILEITHTLVLE